MRLLLIILISILSCMETFSQDRQPYAAGRFYASDSKTLEKDLKDLFNKCKRSPSVETVRAIISPHAGYMFSGEVAASAFSVIPRETNYNNIFIIGSSHMMSFEGASVYYSGDFITPFGKLSVNREIAMKLKENKIFDFPEDAHAREHSLEVQMPFIQSWFRTVPPIVPIIIGTNNLKEIKLIAEALTPLFTPENLFIISSDFSHYPSYKDALETDKQTALSIISGDPNNLLRTLKDNSSKNIRGLATSMCGWTSGLTLMYLAENQRELKYRLVDYANSGDSSYGGKEEVVGYNAIILEGGEKQSTANEEISDFVFTEKEKEQLFRLVRGSIRSKLYGTVVEKEEDISPRLMEPMGAFVTLRINGSLRGCIGRFISSEPLYDVVNASAISSAFEDPRFPALTREEFPEINVEITVLGPLKKIDDIKKIVLGKHGIYIKKGMNSGTMLPQVATENHWTIEQFLGYTSRDKAGIGWEGWKDADIYIYEGVVLEENMTNRKNN